MAETNSGLSSLRIMSVMGTHPEGTSWFRTILIGRNPKVTLFRAGALVVVCFVTFKFILLPIRVEGASMLPAYKESGVNFVNRVAYLWTEPKRGDVVGIRLAGPHIMFMKRIVGLPGETVAFHEGHVIIDGVVLDEPYVKRPCDWERAPVTLGPEEYFFVGDNRSMPQADHTFGRGPRERIIGKILL
jgi:signal peptidase I